MSNFHSKAYITRGTKISGLKSREAMNMQSFSGIYPLKMCIAGWHIYFLQEAYTQLDWRGDGWVFGVAASVLTECDWCGTARYLGCSGKTGSFSSNSILLSSAHVLKIPMHWRIRLQPASRNAGPWEVLTGKSNSLLLKKQGNNHCVPFLQGWLRYN